MDSSSVIDQYRHKIAERLGGRASTFLYWKGRVALYTILRAMGVGAGDEVIVPAYTCVVVPSAIIYVGATPIYVDICHGTYCMDVSKLEEAITPRTKVIIAQNTYGLSASVERIVEIASRHGLYTIEDCAHGFGGTYNGKPNGTYCDASFFSSQWNKPFSTGLGGFGVVHREILASRLQAMEAFKFSPSTSQVMLLSLLVLTRKLFVNDRLLRPMVHLYRWMSKHDLILGSSQKQELCGCAMPTDYFKGFSSFQASQGLKAIDQLDCLLERRRISAEDYTAFLADQGKNHVPQSQFANHAFLRYPLLVKDRWAFTLAAQESDITLGDWFNSPLHPIQNGLKAWHFDESKFPIASEIARKVVNLPTDLTSTDTVISFLRDHMDLIEDA